jgi:DNA-binding NtrC family response regulator
MDEAHDPIAGTGETYADRVARARREIVVSALTAEGGNRSRTAARLGLQRSHLYALLRSLGIDIPPAPREAWARRATRPAIRASAPAHQRGDEERAGL